MNWESIEEHLSEIINNGETDKIEFKKATNSFPKDSYETISSFCNTEGGLIILGITTDENDQNPTLCGVNNPQKVIDEMFQGLNNSNKINRNPVNNNDIKIITLQDKKLVLIHINKANYTQKPIYLNNNPLQSFIRKGTCDLQCSEQEVKAMLRDASEETFDSQILEKYAADDLDLTTVKKYRSRFEAIYPEHPFNKLDDLEFLEKISALKRNRKSKELCPTVAGLLVFGKHSSIKEFLPHYNVEYINKDTTANNNFKDRVIYDGTWGEDNLYNFFFIVIDTIYATLNDSSFMSDSITRQGIQKLKIAIREALVNSIIHCDYVDTKGIYLIRYSDNIVFINGGSLRIDIQDFFTGGHSKPRNYYIQEIFRFIHLCEKAGSGVPKIMDAVEEYYLRYPELNTTFNSVELRLWDTTLLVHKDLEHPTEKDILKILIKQKIVDRAFLDQSLDLHKNTILVYLKSLETKGFIEKTRRGKKYYYTIKQNSDFDKYNHINVMQSLLDELKRLPSH